MTNALPRTSYSDLTQLAQDLYTALDGHIILGIPIGIGKATQMVNALYEVAKKNPSYRLDIHTALSLGRPVLKTEFEKRLLEPFLDRQFKGVPELLYVQDARTASLPANVKIIEFYFKPGEMLKNPGAQQNVLSANYTHVARDMIGRNVNLLIQMISKKVENGHTRYSLSSNPDVTIDLQRMMREKSATDGKKRFAVAQVNPELPFMPNDAEVTSDFFDLVHDDSELYTPLFCTPHQPISQTDHMIGFYTSALVKDGGTLQIGIGSLGDAVVNSLLVRHKKNEDYCQLLDKTNALKKFPAINTDGGTDVFTQGLYGNTEMLVPGYMELKNGGVLKRRVFDDLAIQTLVNEGFDPKTLSLSWFDGLIRLERIDSQFTEKQFNYLQKWGLINHHTTWKKNELCCGEESCKPDLQDKACRAWIEQHALGQKIHGATLMHAGFFVGNSHFYRDLKNMSDEELNEFNMTSVHYTNQLHGNEEQKIAQRTHARFINACMKMTLTGAAVSDGLSDGKVVSGVGGQFNFVSMAHDLPQARSILMMRSWRPKGTQAVSNIVFNYGHATVPRHMRDIVITEYGIADLRGKNDQEIMEELLKVTDSRFQNGLIREAQAAGKLPEDFKLPESSKNNTPEYVASLIQGHLASDFTPFPFGKELTDQEVIIGGALKRLKANLAHKWPLVSALLLPVSAAKVEANKPHLVRMGLEHPSTLKEHIYRKLLLSVLPNPTVKAQTKIKHAKT